MFSSGPNYTKLKTNLKLAQNRLKLLEKKKTEIAQKSRKEIADYLSTGKTERARIRVEHIIREDYLVEAMEVVEMYCDLILARFGLVTQMKELDDGIAEAVSSLVWVCPRMQSDIAELKVICDIFVQKYGPQFAESARTATGDHRVSEKLMHKLQLQAPPKLLVEKYLIEIAKNYNIEYEADPQIMNEDKEEGKDHYLIDLSDRNNLGGKGSSAPPQMGFIGYPTVPPLPQMPPPPSNKPFNYPPYDGAKGAGGNSNQSPFNYNIPPNTSPTQIIDEKKDLNTQFINEESSNELISSTSSTPINYDDNDPQGFNQNVSNVNKPKPQPRGKLPPAANPRDLPSAELPQLPNVPLDLPDAPSEESKPDNDDIDFDDLARRFENLKKRK
ncbi:IST1 homolog isoform X3 [Glossina fuscipes]|uniref:IST1 homolog n=1 Tax=Glossina fuscipes TaxID=7396 RepID=A0A8U0W706_9MUSC|nr:IST1 homolog isoform X3 [Glossina fuscipes]